MRLYPSLLWVLLLFLSLLLAVGHLIPPRIEAQLHQAKITPGLASVEWGMSKEKVKRILVREGVPLEESRYWLILRKGSMTMRLVFTASDELASVETEDDTISYSEAKKILSGLYGQPSSESDHLAKWSIGEEGVHLESRPSGIYQRTFNVPLFVRYEMDARDEKTERAVFSNPSRAREKPEAESRFDLSKPDSDGRYSSVQLKLLLTGKMDTDVLKLLGKPRSVTTLGTTDYWDYGSIAYDELTRRIFSSVQVVFENGFVRRVNFY